MQRDPIYAALLKQLTTLTAPPLFTSYGGVTTVSRGFVTWEDADNQPAIYIVPVTEDAVYTRGLPQKYQIKVDLYVYVRWLDSVNQGMTALAQVMDGIDYVLSPTGPNGGTHGDNGVVNSLGGLVQYCALNGQAQISGGFLNQSQTVARMAVEILVA